MKSQSRFIQRGGTVVKVLLAIMLPTACAAAFMITLRSTNKQMEVLGKREANDKLVDQLVETEKTYALLCQASTADIETVREQLQMQLSDKLIRIHSQLEESDESGRAYAENLLEKFAGDRKLHPERYVSTKHTRYQDAQIEQIFARPLSATSNQ
jgi:hypothetical protein